MAHPCFNCGGECYCSGSWDDVVVDLTPVNCQGCDWCQEQEEMRHAELDDDSDDNDPEYEDYLEDTNGEDLCPNCGHDRYDFSDVGCPQCCPHLYGINLEEDD